jgi:hypothetical protein
LFKSYLRAAALSVATATSSWAQENVPINLYFDNISISGCTSDTSLITIQFNGSVHFIAAQKDASEVMKNVNKIVFDFFLTLDGALEAHIRGKSAKQAINELVREGDFFSNTVANHASAFKQNFVAASDKGTYIGGSLKNPYVSIRKGTDQECGIF